MPKTRHIHGKEAVTASDAGRVVMYLNDQPVVAGPTPTEPISEPEVLTLARQVTGDADVAKAWMIRPNPRLKNRSPQQAIREGDSQKTADILRSFLVL